MRPLLLDESKAMGTAIHLVQYASLFLFVVLGVLLGVLVKQAVARNRAGKSAGWVLLLIGIGGIVFLFVGAVALFSYVAMHAND